METRTRPPHDLRTALSQVQTRSISLWGSIATRTARKSEERLPSSWLSCRIYEVHNSEQAGIEPCRFHKQYGHLSGGFGGAVLRDARLHAASADEPTVRRLGVDLFDPASGTTTALAGGSAVVTATELSCAETRGG
jgi:hypothetical protein